MSPDRLYVALGVDRYISACCSIFETEGWLILRDKAISAWGFPAARRSSPFDLRPLTLRNVRRHAPDAPRGGLRSRHQACVVRRPAEMPLMAFVQWRVDWWPGKGSRIWPLPSPGRSSATAGAATSTEQRPHCSILSRIIARSSKSDMNPGAPRTAPDHHMAQDDPRSPGFATRTSSARRALNAMRCRQFLLGYSLRPSKRDIFSKKAKLGSLSM